MRHTALTMLAEKGCDGFTLIAIAGHASIATPQKYIHPQKRAIKAAFENFDLEQTVPALVPAAFPD
jgi:site-specific recombinase XerD